jgi:hypothetical protein
MITRSATTTNATPLASQRDNAVIVTPLAEASSVPIDTCHTSPSVDTSSTLNPVTAAVANPPVGATQTVVHRSSQGGLTPSVTVPQMALGLDVNSSVTVPTSIVTTTSSNSTVTTAHSVASSNSNAAGLFDSDDDLDDLDSALAHASACTKTPGMTRASKASIHSDAYCNKKRAVIRSFVASLAARGTKYQKFLKTSRAYPDWFIADGPLEAVFVLLSPQQEGERMKKIKTLSEMLIDWVDGLELKVKDGKKKWHAPSTINVMVRSLLAACKDFFGWEFSIADFKFDGGFNAYFKDVVEARRKQDVSEFLKKMKFVFN